MYCYLRLSCNKLMLLRRLKQALFVCFIGLSVCRPVRAQESYFVTYSHQMEDPGDLELETKNVTGSPAGGNSFAGSTLAFEYGLKRWWTSEVYLDGQSTAGESTLFTGFRFENRFRPLLKEHWINPLLYAEFEDLNAADKALLEVVGHDTRQDFLSRNNRRERKREAELRIILSSNIKGWNVSENIIAEKNLAGDPWEFGYALGATRVLAIRASPNPCVLCLRNFDAGLEMYGGLGDRYSFGIHNTSHYLAPIMGWRVPHRVTFKLSPGFGLNDDSHLFLLRFGVSYEVEDIASKLRERYHHNR